MSDVVNIPRRNEQRVLVVLISVTLILAVSLLCFTIANGLESTQKIVIALASLTVAGIFVTGLTFLHFFYTLKNLNE